MLSWLLLKFLGAKECIKYPNGTYSIITGETSWNTCPKGIIPNYQQTSCIQCPPGYFENITECIKCPDNSISDNIGSSKCNICQKETTMNCLQTFCINCSESNYKSTNFGKSSNGYNLDSICPISYIIWPAGIKSIYEKTSCPKCSKGYYSSSPGSLTCTKWPLGYYSELEG